MTAVHQVLVGAAPGDAITEMARQLRAGLESLGPSEIFAFGIDAGTDPRIRPLHELPVPDPSTPIVYHASYGRPEVTEVLATRGQPIVLIHHNVTPTKYFIDHDPRFAAGLEWARVELAHLRDRVVLAVAVSDYNRADLHALGFDDVSVVPAGIDPFRLLREPSSAAFGTAIDAHVGGDYVLCVSQLLPHKRQEIVIGAMHLVQHVHGLDLGLLLVGAERMPRLAVALRRHAERLRVRNCWIAGHVTDRQLATAYRGASMLVSASEHEGVGIPPLEAMAFGVPVIARAVGGVPEAVADGGLLLPADAGPELFAEAIARVHTDAGARRALLVAGQRRAAQLSGPDSVARVVGLIEELVGS